MPTFTTPEPIALRLDLGVGNVHVTASDRGDTTVDVRPSDPKKKGDVAAALQATVERVDGEVLVTAHKGWRGWRPHRGSESIDVTVEVPSGSEVRFEGGVANLRTSGRLGACRFHAGVGDVHVEDAGAVHVKTSVGDVTIGRAAGPTEVVTRTGDVHIDAVEGRAVLKNSNGDTWIGLVTEDARLSAGNGDIGVGRARGDLVAKSSRGNVRVEMVEAGTTVAQSGMGNIEVGIRDGVAAWLELATRFGNVRNELETVLDPADGEQAVEVRATSSFGDIKVHRAP
jgi:DUF4097 and DUF4098 domain-containing protein YvlB